MLQILTTTGTIFAIITLGYVSATRGLLSAAGLKAMGAYVAAFALPALIFNAVAGRDFAEIIHPGYLAAVAFAALVVITLSYLWHRFVFHRTPVASTFAAMGSSLSNSAFVGYPILMLTLPAVAGKALALNMIIENVLVIPLLLAMAAISGGGSRGRGVFGDVARRLISNPVIIAIIAGILVSIGGIELPEIVLSPIEMLAASSAPVALFVVGGTIAGLSWKTIDSRVLAVAAAKLFVLPTFVWVGLMLANAAGFPVEGDLAVAAILLSSMPVAAVYPIFAQQYGEEHKAAVALFVQTVLSFFTISALLFLL